MLIFHLIDIAPADSAVYTSRQASKSLPDLLCHPHLSRFVRYLPEKWPPWPDLPPTVVYLSYPNFYVEPFDYPNPVTGEVAPPPSPRAGGLDFGR